MARFLLIRVAQSVVTVTLVVFVVFVMSRVAGDPVTLLAGFDFSQEDIAEVREELGLNDPLHEQFGRFLLDIARGDFGTSFRTNQPAMDEVLSRAPATAQLALVSMAISLAISIPLGVVAAIKRGSITDSVARFFALLGQATPNFWLGLMLIFFFAVRLGWLPTGGRPDWKALILPAFTLGTASAASITRLTRSAMVDVLNQDYITQARLKGLPERTVVLRHGFRNAMIPVLTILGLQIGILLAGSVIVETIFAWPGVGRLIIQSLGVSDYPVVQAAVLLIATTVVVANLITDIVYMIIDPRIRYA